MKNEETIMVNEFCDEHQIELDFITSLSESGLIEITRLDEKLHLPVSQLSHLKNMARLYYELGINFSGIQTIHYLMIQLNTLRDQVQQLNARIAQYER
jgi:hypothetical protein